MKHPLIISKDKVTYIPNRRNDKEVAYMMTLLERKGNGKKISKYLWKFKIAFWVMVWIDILLIIAGVLKYKGVL